MAKYYTVCWQGRANIRLVYCSKLILMMGNSQQNGWGFRIQMRNEYFSLSSCYYFSGRNMSLAHRFPYNADFERKVFMKQNDCCLQRQESKRFQSWWGRESCSILHKYYHVLGWGRVVVDQTKQVTAVIVVLIVTITWELTLHILHYINCKYRIPANIYLKNCFFQVYNSKYPIQRW